MAGSVEEVSLEKFDRLIRFFDRCTLLINFGYRGEKLYFFNYIFPMIFFISTCFNIHHIFVIFNSENRVQVTYTIIFLAVHLQAWGKGLMLVINYHDLKGIFLELRKFYIDKDNDLVREVRSRHNSTHIRGITYGVISYWTMLWFSEILLQAFIRRVGGMHFPMQYHIPFLSEDNPYFYMVNAVVQDFIFCASMTGIGVSDCMIIMFAFQFRSELVCLAEVISTLEDIEMYKKHSGILLTIFRMHLNLLKLFNNLSDVYFYMSFSQVISTFIGTTFLFYVVFTHGLDIAHLIIIVVVICQIFILCLFGEIIFSRMSALPNTLYLTKWYEFTPEDKWSFLHILHNSQKPCGLKAVGIVDVSIYTFVELMKISASYCVIINALSNKGSSTE